MFSIPLGKGSIGSGKSLVRNAVVLIQIMWKPLECYWIIPVTTTNGLKNIHNDITAFFLPHRCSVVHGLSWIIALIYTYEETLVKAIWSYTVLNVCLCNLSTQGSVYHLQTYEESTMLFNSLSVQPRERQCKVNEALLHLTGRRKR